MAMVKTQKMHLSTDTISHTQKMDRFEASMATLPQVHLPLVHRFTDGMYIREIHMRAGTVVTSRTHKTNHPFVLSKGVCDVLDEQGNIERLSAPHTGITSAGTRRVLVILEDAVWTTFHVTNKKDPDEIADEITESTNPLIPDGFRQACFEKETPWHLQQPQP